MSTNLQSADADYLGQYLYPESSYVYVIMDTDTGHMCTVCHMWKL